LDCARGRRVLGSVSSEWRRCRCGERRDWHVLLLQGISGTLSIRTVGGAGKGITSARAVHAINGREIGVVDSVGGLAAIDVESGSVEWIALAGEAEKFERLDGDVVLLNDVGARPLLLLDTAHGRTPYFVPADRNPGTRRK